MKRTLAQPLTLKFFIVSVMKIRSPLGSTPGGNKMCSFPSVACPFVGWAPLWPPSRRHVCVLVGTHRRRRCKQFVSGGVPYIDNRSGGRLHSASDGPFSVLETSLGRGRHQFSASTGTRIASERTTTSVITVGETDMIRLAGGRRYRTFP